MTPSDRSRSADTTERLDPTHYLSTRSDAFIYACHLATYDFARERVGGRRVLDFGCGVGYGTHRIAPACARIVGVDVSSDAIDEARRRFEAPNLSFEQIVPVEQRPLRFADDEFDVVLSFQVFEHLADPDAYLREVQRVLAPGGLFICVTPDRESRLFARQRPWNEFHLKEYSQAEMADVLRPYFTDVEVAGMSARPDLVDLEVGRARKLKLVTLPVTFPGAPERLRTRGLQLLKKLERRRGSRFEASSSKALRDWGFDEGDVSVFSREHPSLNVVCLARAAG